MGGFETRQRLGDGVLYVRDALGRPHGAEAEHQKLSRRRRGNDGEDPVCRLETWHIGRSFRAVVLSSISRATAVPRRSSLPPTRRDILTTLSDARMHRTLAREGRNWRKDARLQSAAALARILLPEAANSRCAGRDRLWTISIDGRTSWAAVEARAPCCSSQARWWVPRRRSFWPPRRDATRATTSTAVAR